MTTKASAHNKTDGEVTEHLKKLAHEMEVSGQLYSAAVKGLTQEISKDIQELESYDLSAKASKAEDDIAALAAQSVKQDVSEMRDFETVLAEGDTQEDKLLADDELPPEEKGAELSAQGEASD